MGEKGYEMKGKGKPEKEGVKRPLSAYVLYSNDRREQLKKENPKLAGGEVMKKIADDWNKLDEKTKQKYTKMQESLKAKYEVDKEKFNTE